MVKIKYATNPNKLQSELKELYKIQVVNKKVHEIKNERLINYAGEFELFGKLSLGDQIRETHKRLRNMDDLESYSNAIDEGYEAEDAIFIGYLSKVDTPQLNLVNRSKFGNACDFQHEIFEYRGNNCFIPTKGYCFIKCIN